MIDLSGHKIGLLTVKHPCCLIGDKEKRRIVWTCDCDCGTKNHLVYAGNLTSTKKQRSCGCLNSEVVHGHKRRSSGMTPTYQSWRAMKERRLSPKCTQWQNYGGRGIKICEQWLGLEGFNHFLQDMGERPSKKHTLDRIDVNGDYCPENCRWATRVEQCRNTRKNKLWSFQGEFLCETALTEK